MLKAFRSHVRSNVVGYLALVVAMSGTGAWAADKITSKDIARNAVRAKHIKAASVTEPKIAPGSVNAAKLAADVDNTQILWGHVQGVAAPQLISGKGATGVVNVGAGKVQVAFSRNIVGCSHQVSGWLTSAGHYTPSPVFVVYRPATGPNGLAANEVEVQAYRSDDGTLLNSAGYSFTVAVFC